MIDEYAAAELVPCRGLGHVTVCLFTQIYEALCRLAGGIGKEGIALEGTFKNAFVHTSEKENMGCTRRDSGGTHQG